MPKTGSIYFVQAENGAIKIGFTAGQAIRRIGELQTGSAVELRLLAIVPGTTRLEAQLHERFKDSHLRGEWFQPTADLLEVIDKARGDLIERLVPERHRGPKPKPKVEVIKKPTITARVRAVLEAQPDKLWSARAVCRRMREPKKVRQAVYSALMNLWRQDLIMRDENGLFHGFETKPIRGEEL